MKRTLLAKGVEKDAGAVFYVIWNLLQEWLVFGLIEIYESQSKVNEEQ